MEVLELEKLEEFGVLLLETFLVPLLIFVSSLTFVASVVFLKSF